MRLPVLVHGFDKLKSQFGEAKTLSFVGYGTVQSATCNIYVCVFVGSDGKVQALVPRSDQATYWASHRVIYVSVLIYVLEWYLI